MTSEFHPYQPAAPSQGAHDGVNTDGTRWNLNALVYMLVMGCPMPGWNYTNSVTRGQPSPGTADQPLRAYVSSGSGTTKTWIRATLTWDGSGNITKIGFSFSEDNEQSYVPLADLEGNSFVNIAYDGSSNVTAYTWGKS